MKEALETTEEEADDLSPEDKAAREVQKVEAEQARNLVRLKRVEILCEKLIAKLDLYTPSTEKQFIETVKKEAEDLKFESHGVELLHAIGFIYNMKVNQYSSKKFAFGLGGMFHSVKEKSYIFSQTVGTLRSAYDLQSTFGELQKAEENGISEEEKARLEETAAIKVSFIYIYSGIHYLIFIYRAYKLFGEDPNWKLKVFYVMYVMKS